MNIKITLFTLFLNTWEEHLLGSWEETWEEIRLKFNIPARKNRPRPNVPEANILTSYPDILYHTTAGRSCRCQNNTNYLLVNPYN